VKAAGTHWLEAMVRDRGQEMSTIKALQNNSDLARCSNEWIY